MSDDWSCPTDLEDGERIEIYDSTVGLYTASVVDTINGIVSASIDAFMNTVVTIDPRHTKWRRVKPKVAYGVRCSDRFCNEYYPDQVYSENFICYRCRHR